uniref:Uncharacterized protein n=1 Tax=Oryza rufipogon TaxID=4529 RepID=A0A0E0R893_ORYRU
MEDVAQMHGVTILEDDSDHKPLFEKALVGQINIEDTSGKAKDVISEEGSSEEMKDSDNDVGMVTWMYFSLMVRCIQVDIKRKHMDGTSVEITSKLVILLISHCCFFSHCFFEIRYSLFISLI